MEKPNGGYISVGDTIFLEIFAAGKDELYISSISEFASVESRAAGEGSASSAVFENNLWTLTTTYDNDHTIAADGEAQPLHYGELVQLRHYLTNKFLCVHADNFANLDTETGMYQVSVGEATEAARWRFEPSSHARERGAPILADDMIVLQHNVTGNHVRILMEHLQVRIAFEGTQLRIRRWASPMRSQSLKFGAVCVMRHRQHDTGFISTYEPPQIKQQAGEQPPRLRSGDSQFMADMWMLEGASPFVGGNIQWGSLVRLRHLMSGKYLALSSDVLEKLRGNHDDSVKSAQVAVPTTPAPVPFPPEGLGSTGPGMRSSTRNSLARASLARGSLARGSTRLLDLIRSGVVTDVSGVDPDSTQTEVQEHDISLLQPTSQNQSTLLWRILPCSQDDNENEPMDVGIADSFLLQHNDSQHFLHVNSADTTRLTMVRAATLDDAWYTTLAPEKMMGNFWLTHAHIRQLSRVLTRLLSPVVGTALHPPTMTDLGELRKPLLVLLRILDTEATDVHRLLPFFSHSLSDVQAMLDSDHAIVLGLQVLKVAYSMPSTTQVQRPAGQQDITPLSLRKLACEFLEKMVRNNSSVAVVLFREVFCTGTYQKAFLTEGKEDEALFSVLTTMFHANVDLCMTVLEPRYQWVVLKWIALMERSSSHIIQAIVRLLQTLCLSCSYPSKVMLTAKEIARRKRMKRRNQEALITLVNKCWHKYQINEPIDDSIVPAGAVPTEEQRRTVLVPAMGGRYLHDLFSKTVLTTPEWMNRKRVHLAMLDLVLALVDGGNENTILQVRNDFPLDALCIGLIPYSEDESLWEPLQTRLLRLLIALHVNVSQHHPHKIHASRIWEKEPEVTMIRVTDVIIPRRTHPAPAQAAPAPSEEEMQRTHTEERCNAVFTHVLKELLVYTQQHIDLPANAVSSEFTEDVLQLLEERVRSLRLLIQYGFGPAPDQPEFVLLLYVMHALWRCKAPEDDKRAVRQFERVQHGTVKMFHLAHQVLLEQRIQNELKSFRRDVQKQEFAAQTLSSIAARSANFEMASDMLLDMWKSALEKARQRTSGAVNRQQPVPQPELSAEDRLKQLFGDELPPIFHCILENAIADGPAARDLILQPPSLAPDPASPTQTAVAPTSSTPKWPIPHSKQDYIYHGAARQTRQELSDKCIELIEQCT